MQDKWLQEYSIWHRFSDMKIKLNARVLCCFICIPIQTSTVHTTIVTRIQASYLISFSLIFNNQMVIDEFAFFRCFPMQNSNLFIYFSEKVLIFLKEKKSFLFHWQEEKEVLLGLKANPKFYCILCWCNTSNVLF